MQIEELIDHEDILIMDSKKLIIYWREDNPVHTRRKDKQALRKKKKRTFLFKDKENINYSNYFKTMQSLDGAYFQ